MNTVIENKPETTSETPKSYTDIRAQWKEASSLRILTSSDIAALCLYRSMIRGEGKEGAIKRLQKSFTPISNPVKLQNGAYTWAGLMTALHGIRSSRPYLWANDDEKKELLELAKSINAYGKEIK